MTRKKRLRIAKQKLAPNKRNKAKTKGVFLLSVGDELLDGRTQNTNASWMGEQLRLAGVPVAEVRCVSDQIDHIVSTLRDAKKFPFVVATGGLGPTNDDRTLEAAARAFRRPLVQTKASYDHIKKRYEARNLPLTEARLRLAQVPKGCEILQNPTGTAPGVYVKAESTQFFFLPGPPSECRPMFEKDILPILQKARIGKKLQLREFWRTFGKGESDVYQRIAPLVEELEQLYPHTFTFGVHISFPCIDLTFEVWDVPGEKRPSKKEISEACRKITNLLGPLCFTRTRESLVDVVARLLQERKQTVAVAESCTGGLVGKLLTDISGISSVFLGGVISYANSAKQALLDVDKQILSIKGAVSEQTVRQMAESIRKKLQADYALALSGVSGPLGGSVEKPVGTIYVALSSKRETKVAHQVILNGKGSRDQNRVIAAHLALNALRAEILGLNATGIPVN